MIDSKKNLRREVWQIEGYGASQRASEGYHKFNKKWHPKKRQILSKIFKNRVNDAVSGMILTLLISTLNLYQKLWPCQKIFSFF